MVQVQALGSFGLDAHLVNVDAEQVGHPGAHFFGYGPDLWGIQDQGCIDVHDAVAGVLQFLHGEVQEDGGVSIFPARIAGRKEAADIARSHCAEQRVGNGVQQHVAIGVAGQPFRVLEGQPANAQGYVRLECVRVIAKSNACIHDLRGSPSLFFGPLPFWTLAAAISFTESKRVYRLRWRK